MLLAQEQVRSINGLHVITQLTCIQPRSWPCIKAALGLIRNFCSNQLNANQLRANCMIEKLMQILYDAYTEIQIKAQAQQSQANLNAMVVKIEDVNLYDIVEASSSALLCLAKEYQNQIIMKDLDCIGFFVQMFYSPIGNNTTTTNKKKKNLIYDYFTVNARLMYPWHIRILDIYLEYFYAYRRFGSHRTGAFTGHYS